MQIIYNLLPWVSIHTAKGGGQLVDTDRLPATMAGPQLALNLTRSILNCNSNFGISRIRTLGNGSVVDKLLGMWRWVPASARRVGSHWVDH
jgi:hypothetical protein